MSYEIIEKRYAEDRDIRKLAEYCSQRNIDVLGIVVDGVRGEDGIPGLTYHVETMALFERFSRNILELAYEHGQMFQTVDEYVWFYVSAFAEDIVCHWADEGEVVQCVECETWVTLTDSYEDEGEKVCSRNCIVVREHRREEEEENEE